jgi:hypothetical protein
VNAQATDKRSLMKSIIITFACLLSFNVFAQSEAAEIYQEFLAADIVLDTHSSVEYFTGECFSQTQAPGKLKYYALVSLTTGLDENTYFNGAFSTTDKTTNDYENYSYEDLRRLYPPKMVENRILFETKEAFEADMSSHNIRIHYWVKMKIEDRTLYIIQNLAGGFKNCKLKPLTF